VSAVGVGIVGAGVISRHYLRHLARCPDVAVRHVSDVDVERARAAADEFGVPAAGTVAEQLARPDVELVVNLTVPAAHAEVAEAALAAGKHVYGEKPLALDPAAGAKLLALAAERGLRVGNAPDTFLGAGLQSARRALDDGVIGRPVSVATVLQGPGPEAWHPNPDFYYQVGGGPLFDMGPYYLTALVGMFGPVTRVAGSARRARERRLIGSGPRAGVEVVVDVATHVTALLDFAGGVSASSTFSFDSSMPRAVIEVIGTEGTLSVPDPNRFDGPARVHRVGDDGWRDLPVSGSELGRGMGVVELARALRTGEPHRASGELAGHVLDTMAAILDSAGSGAFRPVSSTVDRPAVLPADWDPTAATLEDA
jgi:predicted dehydrogenase